MGIAVAAVAMMWPAIVSAQTATNWLGGTGNWNDATKWDNGVPNSATSDARIDNGNAANSPVTINGNFTVGSLEIDLDDSASLNNALAFTLAAGGFTGAGVLTNNGSFTLNSGGNNTDFIISGAGSILGTGTFTLTNTAARMYASNNTDRLTIGTGQTVQGTGQIGIGALSLTNNGLIDANSNGNTLFLQPNSGTDFTNNATMQASGGGILQLQSGSFINTNGTIQALAGSKVNLNSSSTSGGILTTTGTGEIHNNTHATLTSVTNNGSLFVDNAQILDVSTGLTNNGILTINSGGNNTDLVIANALTIGGTGTITMTNGNARIYAANTTDRLTIGANQTLQGTGQIGIGNLALTNNGLINANSGGNTLLLQPNTGASEDFTNTATMEASSSGILQLNGGSFINTGGTIEALAGSTVNIFSGSNISGGILTTVTTGTMHLESNAVLTSVTNDGSNLFLDNSHIAFLSSGLTNNGTFTINSAGNITDLKINNALTIGGSGSVNLTNGAARIYATNNTDRLTIGANQTLQGTGQIGAGSMALTNGGLINANSSGNTLTLQPNGGVGEDVTNNATMEASGGGILVLQGGGPFDGSGTIQALNGSTVQLKSGANVSGGTLTTAGTGEIHNLNTATLTSVTNNGTMIGDNTSVTSLSTGLTNNGTLTINSAGNNTDLAILNPLTIGGSGSINLTNSAARVYANNNTDLLTVGSSQTIQGTGQIGIGDLALTNNGLINANSGGNILTLQPNGSVAFTNNATMESSSGGILALNAGSFINTNGTIEALNGSKVTMNVPTITGGILTTAGTGEIHNTNSGELISVTNNGTLIADNTTITYLSTGLTNNGSLTINSAGNNTDMRILDALTIGGTGSITLTNGAARIFANNNVDRLTVGASETIQGTGQIGAGSMALTSGGLINANSGGNTLTMQPNAGIGEDFTNSVGGIWQASNGGTLSMPSGKFTNNGTVQALDNSTVTFAASANLTNNSAGTLTGGTYAAVSTTHAATVNLSGGNVTNDAAVVILNGALASIPQINTISQIQSAGEFHVLGGKIFTTAGALTNAGTTEVGTASTLTVIGNYVQTSGLSIVNGLLTATGGNAILNGGTLMGAGTVSAIVNNSLGTVSPGNSPGELTVSGYVSSSSSVLDIELAGTTPGTDYDVLHDLGGASIAGTLNVSLLSFTPSFGQTFTILDSTGLTGTFTTVNLPPDLTISYTPTSVILTGVPEPAGLGLTGLGALLALRRRKRNAGQRPVSP